MSFRKFFFKMTKRISVMFDIWCLQSKLSRLGVYTLCSPTYWPNGSSVSYTSCGLKQPIMYKSSQLLYLVSAGGLSGYLCNVIKFLPVHTPHYGLWMWMCPSKVRCGDQNSIRPSASTNLKPQYFIRFENCGNECELAVRFQFIATICQIVTR
jgi:hypothetical protein